MRKKNGFSLVEILAIIIIVGIISGVAIWGIMNITDKEENATNKTLNQKIENAAHLYAAKYYASDIVECTTDPCKKGGNDIKFTLKDLAEDGLLKLSDDECHSATGSITILYNSSDNRIKYNYKEISDKAFPSVSNCFKCSNVYCYEE